MTSPQESADLQWRELVDLEEQERQELMKSRYRELATLSEDERVSRLTDMEKAVYELPEDKVSAFTLSRLRVWLDLEHDLGQMISTSYDQVTDHLPGTIAIRHVALLQTMSREFSGEDQGRLRVLFPRVFGALPHFEQLSPDSPTPAPLQSARVPDKKKSWWAFWSR